jgi:hypothetical protein
MNHTTSEAMTNNFYFVNVMRQGTPQRYATVPYGDFRKIMLFAGSFSADPGWMTDWYLRSDSPCLNAGSLNLNPGYTMLRLPDWPVRDRGELDIGYHHPIQPNLLTVTNVSGNIVHISALALARGDTYELEHQITPDWNAASRGTITFSIEDNQSVGAPRLGIFWYPEYKPPKKSDK